MGLNGVECEWNGGLELHVYHKPFAGINMICNILLKV